MRARCGRCLRQPTRWSASKTAPTARANPRQIRHAPPGEPWAMPLGATLPLGSTRSTLHSHTPKGAWSGQRHHERISARTCVKTSRAYRADTGGIWTVQWATMRNRAGNASSDRACKAPRRPSRLDPGPHVRRSAVLHTPISRRDRLRPPSKALLPRSASRREQCPCLR